MRLILHIGTHKTGSTALQHFLSANRKELSEYGIYYASPVREFNLNSIANAILLDGQEKFQYFFLEKLRNAERNVAHTIIASSENLYAMVLSLMRFNAKKTSVIILTKDHILIECMRT